MEIKNIELTEGQLNNLLIFLQTVSLKGNEVPAFVEIVNAIQKAKESQ